MTSDKLKLIFARLRELFNGEAEDILRLFIAINFGREHISELTDKEMDILLKWVDDTIDSDR